MDRFRAAGPLYVGLLLLALRWTAMHRYGALPRPVDRLFLLTFGLVLLSAAGLQGLVGMRRGRPGALVPAYALALAAAAVAGAAGILLGGNQATAILFGFLTLSGVIFLIRLRGRELL